MSTEPAPPTTTSRSLVDIVLFGCVVGGVLALHFNVSRLEERVQLLEEDLERVREPALQRPQHTPADDPADASDDSDDETANPPDVSAPAEPASDVSAPAEPASDVSAPAEPASDDEPEGPPVLEANVPA